MNTNDTITSERVIAFLRAQCETSGIPGMKMIVSWERTYFHFIACAPDGVGGAESAKTAEEAIELLRAKIPTPEQVAEKKREQIARLQAELAKQESPRDDDEPNYDAPKPLTPLENYHRNDEHSPLL